jgi:hypothetical protein
MIIKLVVAACPYCGARLPIGNGDTGDFSREIEMWGNLAETMLCEECGNESKKPKKPVNKRDFF